MIKDFIFSMLNQRFYFLKKSHYTKTIPWKIRDISEKIDNKERKMYYHAGFKYFKSR